MLEESEGDLKSDSSGVYTLDLCGCFVRGVVVVLFLRQGLIDLKLLSRPGRLASESQESASCVLGLPFKCGFWGWNSGTHTCTALY